MARDPREPGSFLTKKERKKMIDSLSAVIAADQGEGTTEAASAIPVSLAKKVVAVRRGIIGRQQSLSLVGDESQDEESDPSDDEEEQPTGSASTVVDASAIVAARLGKSTVSSSSSSSAAQATSSSSKPTYKRRRVLVLSSRGTSQRQRHFLNDVRALLPHSRKESKMDANSADKLVRLNELAELANCNRVVYLDAKKGRDLYLWLANAPHGPSVRFHVQNLHTMAELKLTGNALSGSRPLLLFAGGFEAQPHLTLIRHMLQQTFNPPSLHPRTKPFVDKVMSFFHLKGKIWVRHYQVVWGGSTTTEPETRLIEIGPRFVMTPMRILSGSFLGSSIYVNGDFVHPALMRRMARVDEAVESRDNARSRAAASRARSDAIKVSASVADPLARNALFADK
eukprot:CAMPEP_0170740952 /NCGR_PEP_ID=MMETSP0437-20130122/5960_1 /TAXON_ID=0 /ORGANISM="Sexangularia sp." /LENGTH=396 /DNA_ID=CAMNT_0011079491 /DNA_START=97 /DNA_END=1287 /DNA_ORIENTATION=+